MNSSHCRWGILGTAGIARKNWGGLYHAANATITGVASREQSRADEFIDSCQKHYAFSPRPTAFGSYEAMLESDQIDAVYIPLPTGLRKEWVIRAAEKGKHVLGEKPVAVTTSDAEEMTQACQANGVQFMDGVMFMHSDRLPAIRSLLDTNEIGPLKRISTNFAFAGGEEFLRDNIRTDNQLEPAGCVGDLGWYNIRFSLWAMGGKLPKSVTGRTLSSHQRGDGPAVPIEFSGELFFDDGVSSGFYCSFISYHQQWVTLGGTEGVVHVPDFVLPFYDSQVEFNVSKAFYRIEGCDFNMERRVQRHAVQEYATGAHNSQETKMISSFSQNVLTGQIDDQWPRIALQTQKVLDACLKSAENNGERVML